MADPFGASDSDGPIINDNVIRIQLRKPQHRKWELRTRNRSPGLVFPTIQLFDCEGNILVETNDDNISITSSDCHGFDLKPSQSLNEKDHRHLIKNGLKKSHTVAGNNVYTRLYKNVNFKDDEGKETKTTNKPKNKTLKVIIPGRQSSIDSILASSDVFSERDNSSYKSSDNDSSTCEIQHSYVTSNAGTLLISPDKHFNSPFRRHRPELPKEYVPSRGIIKTNEMKSPVQRYDNGSKDQNCSLQKSKSFHSSFGHPIRERPARRSKTEVLSPRPEYAAPSNKISFLDTYLRSLPNRTSSNPEWCAATKSCPNIPKKIDGVVLRESSKLHPDKEKRYGLVWEDRSDSDILNVSSDVAAAVELERRLRQYRRGVSEVDSGESNGAGARIRRKSEGDCEEIESTSSESPDEADAVLNRLKRRILKNKCRERRTTDGHQHRPSKKRPYRPPLVEQSSIQSSIPDEPVAPHGSRPRLEECCRRPGAMGSNISHHSVKGLTGRRARSSGDLCNGDPKSPAETSVYGSVVGEVMGWNRSLPNHLDGNRHLTNDYSGTMPRGNNNYGEGSYHSKGVRAWRYRASKSGSEAEPVWKLQDPGCDQGYGSERSPEEDYPPPARPVTYEEYEAQLRLMYPFITEENTFTVVVEKDGRGLGMSVSGGDAAGGEGGALVRIRRLYPPQPAWRTGRLAPRDLLLAANGTPLAGLSTYEALEVLRTTDPRVELRVCRPPADVLDCLTPPAPPTPPARHTPMPPPDPLNCHPLHTRLSATTSSATTSSSEGRCGSARGACAGGRDASPQRDRPGTLAFADLDRPLPIYDVQYGEFDIIMTKVGGSLGFTLRKEDHSALGHYVRALVREPALSDGRIQPGDRIVAVNEVSMSGMSHADAVAFLRACGAEVRLRLYRDHAATPLSPLSPQESQERHSPSDSDTATIKPKPHLRQEAVNMLSDLAARRLTPDAAPDGSRSPCLSPRKYRRLTRDCTGVSQNSDNEPYTVVCPTSTDNSTDHEDHPRPQHFPRPLRPLSLDLRGPPTPHNSRKQTLPLTVAPHGYELNNLGNDVLDAPSVYQEDMRQQRPGAHFHSAGQCRSELAAGPTSMPVEMSSEASAPPGPQEGMRHQFPTAHYHSVGHFQSEMSSEPISMPVDMSSGDDAHFTYRHPAYQSAVVHPSSNDNTGGHESHKDDGYGLKKWKGYTLSPDNERKVKTEFKPKIVDPVQKENVKPEEAVEISREPTIVTVELNRGWNSRLGFSVQSHPESGQSYVSAIYSDSVAARDGRLRKGDVILQVNDENVTSMKTPEVIDLMRILRGSICITVLRPNVQ